MTTDFSHSRPAESTPRAASTLQLLRDFAAASLVWRDAVEARHPEAAALAGQVRALELQLLEPSGRPVRRGLRPLTAAQHADLIKACSLLESAANAAAKWPLLCDQVVHRNHNTGYMDVLTYHTLKDPYSVSSWMGPAESLDPTELTISKHYITIETVYKNIAYPAAECDGARRRGRVSTKRLVRTFQEVRAEVDSRVLRGLAERLHCAPDPEAIQRAARRAGILADDGKIHDSVAQAVVPEPPHLAQPFEVDRGCARGTVYARVGGVAWYREI